MRYPLFLACSLAVFSSSLSAQTAPFAQYAGGTAALPGRSAAPAPVAPHSDREQTLPIRSVSLYTNGVAFVELAGTVHGDALVRIDLTTAQLNDALASLTAWDLNGGKVTGGGYHAAPAAGSELHTLLPNLGPNPTQVEVLRALKGKTVEVHNGKSVVVGRILNVETRNDAPATLPLRGALPPVVPAHRNFLSLVSDKGSIKSVELTSDTEVRVLGPEGLQLTRALRLIDTAPPTPEMRHLTLEDRGAGTRELHISYLMQAPAWKSTYRALFEGKDSDRAKLEGFAVIDNATADDWKNVKLTLVSGAPQSFIQQISRPLVYLRPQVQMPKPGTPLKTPAMPLIAMADPLAGAVSSADAGRGITQSQSSQAPTPEAATLPATPATTTDLGVLFEYHLSQPVTVARGQSINVPILDTSVEAERVTVWSPHKDNRPAMRALYFVNNTGLMLDRGAFTVLVGNAFAGEGELELTHPSERRLVRYGTDESIFVSEFKPWKQPEPYIRLYEVKDGELTVHRRAPFERDFKIRNTSGAPTKVVIQITGTDHWTNDPEAAQPVERIGNLNRFELTAKPGDETTFRFVETHASPRHYKLDHLTEADIRSMLKESGNNPGFSALLQPFLDTRKQLAELDRRMERNAESERLAESEESRIRSNMAALNGKGSASLQKQYSDEMSAQESKLSALHKEKEDILEQRHALEDGLTAKATALPAAKDKLRA